MIDLSLAELPKTTKDPLLASRELLSSRSLQEREKTMTQVNAQQKKITKSITTMENCDVQAINNPQYVSLYAKEVFDHLLSVEVYLLLFEF